MNDSMNRNVEFALSRATDTKYLLVKCGAIESVADAFISQFHDSEAIIISEESMMEYVEKVLQQFDNKGVKHNTAIIFENKDLYAHWGYIEKLDEILSNTDAIPVAIGSGTINDLVKLSSHHNNRNYLIVATAASMDGYTAFGASITKDGSKETFSCPAPRVLIADIDIIASAPLSMTASGYADLFAKVASGADWILADAMGVEAIDPVSFSIVQNGLHQALSDPNRINSGDKVAIQHLIEGLILSGFAMQSHKSSRPASGADHQFSHLWNMQHHTMENGSTPSHGFQVSIGTLVSLALYEELLKFNFQEFDIDKVIDKWPSKESQIEKALSSFKGTDFPTIGATEVAAKYNTKEEIREQFIRLKENWTETRERLKNQLIPLDKAVEMLKVVGAPTHPLQIGISMEKLRESVILAQMIRRRFTILDFALRADLLDSWLDNVFNNPIWNN